MIFNIVSKYFKTVDGSIPDDFEGNNWRPEFCPTLRLVYFIAWVSASTCALSSVYSLPCDNFVQKVVPQVKKLSLYLTDLKDLYVSRVIFRKK
jgi:hypothetical protein